MATSVLGALILAVAVPAHALDPDKSVGEYVHKTWTEDEGLPHPIVSTVYQARDGYLWLGSQGGLVRFDGWRFVTFDTVHTPAIVENSMRSIAQTPDGALYVAPLLSDLLRVKDGAVERLAGLLPETWKATSLRDLFVDSRGTLWVVADDGVARLDGEGRLHVLVEGSPPTDLTYARRRMVEDQTGDLWVSGRSGVRRVVGDSLGPSIVEGSVHAICACPGGELWYELDGLGLRRVRGGRVEAVALPTSVPADRIAVKAILGDRDGNVWVGTNVGAFRIQPSRGDAAEALLPGVEIEDLIEGKEGSLWVATRQGLTQILDPPFRTYAAVPGQQEVTALIEDSEAVIWFVTRQPPQLQRIEGHRAVAVRGDIPAGLETIFQDRHGRLLLGAAAGLFAREGGRWLRLPESPQGPIVAIAEDASGRLWTANEAGRVYRLAPRLERSFDSSDGLPGARIERLYAARDGSLWVATHRGVYRIVDDRVVEVHLAEEPAWRYVRHVSEDAEGVLWIGSRHGLTRLVDGTPFFFGPNEGLPDPIVHAVVDDLAGHLFVGSSRGVYRVAKVDLEAVAAGRTERVHATVFGRRGGIVSSQAWGNTAVRARDGSLWFPTRRGVSSIPADRLNFSSEPPNALLESVVINGMSRDPRREALIEPGAGRLEFRFTALSFTAPTDLRFRYRLDGLDSDWREAGKEREAIYAHVAPRRYVFRVQAAQRDGVFDRSDTRFAFTLRPRWHEAIWARVAGVLGLVGIFLVAHRWRTRALRDRERELATRVDDRTQALRREVADRSEAEAEVRRLAGALEERVEERTAELAAEKERLAVTLRSIGDGVIATDVHGTVMLLNRVAEGLTGWTQREAAGRPLAEVFSLIDRFTRGPLPDPVSDVIRQAVVLELPSQAVLVSRDGRERLIADSAAPIRDRESRVTGAVVVFRDVTEKRKIEEHLAHSEKLESLGILAAGIAHDFNNLLTGVFGFIDLARRDAPEDGAVQAKLTKALEGLNRARGLSGQLLTFTAGGVPVTAPTDIAQLVREGVRFALSGSNVTGEIEIRDDLWSCEVDPGQMAQVVDNLVINARQAMPDGGRIEVRVENVLLERDPILPDGRHVKISVRDQGGGIPVEHQARVFHPFFTTKPGGSGLGLATAHSIVTRHRGHIDFESVAGEGTTFSIWIPAATSAAPEPPTPRADSTSVVGRILVMDDEGLVREVLRESLEAMGLEADAVGDGAAAVEAARTALAAGRPFDLVILDLTIAGGMGGVETISRLRAIDPSIRAIASSGYSSDPVMAEPGRFGFQGTLTKPYSVSDLRKTIAALLDRPPAGPGGDGAASG